MLALMRSQSGEKCRRSGQGLLRNNGCGWWRVEEGDENGELLENEKCLLGFWVCPGVMLHVVT